MIRILPLFLLISLSVFSQTTFDRVYNVPVTDGPSTLRFPWAGGINFPYCSQIDLNNDGRLDLFMFDHHNNRIVCFTNNGSTSADLAWDYAPQYATQFPPVNKFTFLYDYNCDGKADFFTLALATLCANGISVYKNVSTGGNLQWTFVDTCIKESFGASRPTIFTNGTSLPHFNDIDNDGDMDIFGFNTIPDGRVIYHKNYSMEHFGNCDSLDFNLETFCWGNFFLNIGNNSNSVGGFHSPCRIAFPHADDPVKLEEPVYEPSESAKRDDTVASLYAVDLDSDHNMELLVGDIASRNTLMIHNGGGDMDSQDTLFPSYNTSAFFNGFHYHLSFDADNDGRKDLLVMPFDHENKKGLWLYKDIGTGSNVTYQLEMPDFLQKDMIDVGEDACPVLTDIDCDNLLDLVISKAVFDSVNGAYKTGLYLYKNNGTITSPSFTYVTNDFGNLTSGNFVSPLYPAFGDIDADGDKDLLIGTEDGKFNYYQNTAGACNPPVYAAPVGNYMGIDVGKYATPQLYDIDKNGILDLLCGLQRGSIFFFKNNGTANAPAFSTTPTDSSLGCIQLNGPNSTDGYTVPFFYDSAGQTRLVVSNMVGNIFEYNNIDGNLSGCFNQVGTIYNPVESSRIKFNLTVSGGDLNGDTLTDLVVGQSSGGVELFFQHNPLSSIPELTPFPAFNVYPNPANDIIRLNFVHLKNSSTITVFSSDGKMILRENVSSDTVEINSSDWSEGIYFIQLYSGSYSIGKKVVKARN